MILSRNDPGDIFMSPPPPVTTSGTDSTTHKQQQSNGCCTISNSSNGTTDNNSTTTDTSTNSKATSSTTMATTTRQNHTILSHSLHENMLEKHHKIDPMEFYTIETVLGEGSMVCFCFCLTTWRFIYFLCCFITITLMQTYVSVSFFRVLLPKWSKMIPSLVDRLVPILSRNIIIPPIRFVFVFLYYLGLCFVHPMNVSPI